MPSIQLSTLCSVWRQISLVCSGRVGKSGFSTISVFVNLSIECLHCKRKKKKWEKKQYMLLTYNLWFSISTLSEAVSQHSVSVKHQSDDDFGPSSKRWITQWHFLFLFSQFVTSKRDITLFLNKHFFCDKRLWLCFYICFTSQQYRFSIYTGTKVQSARAKESLCVCVCARTCAQMWGPIWPSVFCTQWDILSTDLCAWI